MLDVVIGLVGGGCEFCDVIDGAMIVNVESGGGG